MSNVLWPNDKVLDLDAYKDEDGKKIHLSFAFYPKVYDEFIKSSNGNGEKLIKNLCSSNKAFIYFDVYSWENHNRELYKLIIGEYIFNFILKKKEEEIDYYDDTENVNSEEVIAKEQETKKVTFKPKKDSCATTLLITGFFKKDTNTAKLMAKIGLCIYSKNIGFTVSRGGYDDITYGQYFDDCYNESIVNFIKEIGLFKPEKKKEEIDKKWEKILNYAEKFTTYEDDLEKAKQLTESTCVYESFSSVLQSGNEDAKYAFKLDKIYKNYEVNNKVEINNIDLTDKPIVGDICEIDPENKILTVVFHNQISVSEIPSKGVIRIFYSNIQTRVKLDVINKLRNLECGKKLNNIFKDYQTEEIKSVNFDDLEKKLKQQKYPPNPSQVKAIENGIASKDITLVLGPPGTGKTTVILEWVKYFVNQGKRVLISSQNNKAVDNVIERLPEEFNKKIIRIGNLEKVQENVQNKLYEQKVNNLSDELLISAQKLISDSNKKLNGLYQKVKNREKLIKEHVETFEKLESEYGKIKIDELEKIINNKYEKMNDLFKKIAIMRLEINNLNVKIKSKFNLFKIVHKKMLDDKQEKITKLIDEYNECGKVIKETNNKYRIKALDDWVEKIGFIYKSHLQIYNDRSSDLEFIINYKKVIEDFKKGKIEDEFKNEIESTKMLIKECYVWTDELSKRNDAIASEILINTMKVVGATCVGVSSKKIFRDVHFDVTIIDESGQIQLHNALIPMSRSDKVIMLGDHKQIPPMPNQDVLEMVKQMSYEIDNPKEATPQELYENSFFQYLYEKAIPKSNKILLDTQFRMPNTISDIISIAFYDNKYYAADFKKNLPSIIPNLFKEPLCLIDTFDGSSERFEVEDKKNDQVKYYNIYEANIIVTLVDYILRKNLVPITEIGIIVPYSRQLQYIRELLKEKLSDICTASQIKDLAGTLDSFQGQERELIIYGITRSNKRSKEAKRIGFLSELRRFNVALTRCKKQVVIIGDFKFLMECENEGNESISDYSDDLNTQITVYKPSTEKQFGEFVKLMVDHVVNKKQGAFLNSKDIMEVINNG